MITGGGWAYLNLVQQTRIDTLESQLSTKQTELASKQQIADQYDHVLERYETALYYFNNYDKALFTSSNEDKVFNFINDLNRDQSVTDFTFSFADSTTRERYGIITMNITGEGYYRHFVNFIRKIEWSKPLSKVKNLNISPINTLEDYGKVTYNFTLESYYDRARLLDNPEFTISSSVLRSVYNPFYPLIRDIQPNTENLTNIESSSLLALSADKVYIVDQHGVMQRLQVGDQVYLGSLRSINLKQQSATFLLNKGGIIELVTLEVQQ